MKIYEVLDPEGRMFAFEVNNTWIGREYVVEIAAAIPGVRILKVPIFLSWFREDTFCQFELNGVVFEGWEPFGDSDRFWIGPAPPRWVPETETVRKAFESAYAPFKS